MENNKNKKSVKFQGETLNFYDFIQVFVFTRNHHLNNNPTKIQKQNSDKSITVTARVWDFDAPGHSSAYSVSVRCMASRHMRNGAESWEWLVPVEYSCLDLRPHNTVD